MPAPDKPAGIGLIEIRDALTKASSEFLALSQESACETLNMCHFPRTSNASSAK